MRMHDERDKAVDKVMKREVNAAFESKDADYSPQESVSEQKCVTRDEETDTEFSNDELDCGIKVLKPIKQ